jgi:CRISPR-associated protein Csx10
MKVIQYRIDLLEPTLVTSLLGDPNSGVAFEYLPGSVLRGILIGKYLNTKSADASDITDVSDASDPTLRRLFFDGTTRYLNGYPLDGYDHPGLPVPASWQHVKGQENEIFDFAIEPQDDRQQWQSVSALFYTQSGRSVRLIRPVRNIAVHTQRTARFGRAVPEYRPPRNGQGSMRSTTWLDRDEIPGAVYRYDALAAGQTFQAAIICDNDADEPTLLKLLQDLTDGHVTLGGSRSGGYGRASISQIDNEGADRHAAEDEEDTPEDKLIVTLQSDVLLRDERGQFAVDPELLRRALTRHLGVELKLEDAFLRTEVVGGFNRKWGLPLPQTLAVRMGSVLVFKDPDCVSTLLDKLEIRGIGERRAEGFGRIVFNRQRVEELTVDHTPKSRDLVAFTVSEVEAHTLAGLMVDRMLRQRLGEWVLAEANEIKIKNPPSNAQISRLRSVVLEEIRAAAPGTARICQFIKSVEKRSSARRQFERSIVDGKPLLRWLKDLLQCESEGVWTMDDHDWKNILHISGVETSIGIGDVKAEINDGLRLEYVLQFIDLVLAHAAKEQREEN